MLSEQEIIKEIVRAHNRALMHKQQGHVALSNYFAGVRSGLEWLIGKPVIKILIGDYRSNVPSKVLDKYIADGMPNEENGTNDS